MAMYTIFRSTLRLRRQTSLRIQCIAVIICGFVGSSALIAGPQRIASLRDFEQTEVKSSGFVLPREMQIRIAALGGGIDRAREGSSGNMYAYGWILNADTRKTVWKMNRDNTSRADNDNRSFDGAITLPAGSYELYFAAYGFTMRTPFTSFSINIDRREDTLPVERERHRGFVSWLEDIFGGDYRKEWKKRSKEWGIDLYTVDNNAPRVSTFIPPKDFPVTLFKVVRLGENDNIRQAFLLKHRMALRIYALGERTGRDQFADYGWIIDARTRKRVWELSDRNARYAGGAEKNVVADDTGTFVEGEYVLYYNTDNSHSFLDWNAAPPDDPFNYGITLMANDPRARDDFELTTIKEDQNIIAQLTRLGDDEMRSTTFALRAPTNVRIYAIGERQNSRREMADYGWIVNAKTRERVWSMDVDRTEHAGGAAKNRMIDEVIALPEGTYTVYFRTDDSHAYNDWNAAPPFDPESWGITVTGVGEQFNPKIVEKNISPRETGVIAQIVRVGDRANQSQPFRLRTQTRVRIYVLGEGQAREMFDYGWIEDARTKRVIWEMTYAMTFHAGGARKNRMVNTNITLNAGDYVLHYVSDDSHSFGNWNSDPPDDPTMWGITLYEGE
jgi:hypothetical protein